MDKDKDLDNDTDTNMDTDFKLELEYCCKIYMFASLWVGFAMSS
jgi:hypothetical protein